MLYDSAKAGLQINNISHLNADIKSRSLNITAQLAGTFSSCDCGHGHTRLQRQLYTIRSHTMTSRVRFLLSASVSRRTAPRWPEQHLACFVDNTQTLTNPGECMQRVVKATDGTVAAAAAAQRAPHLRRIGSRPPTDRWLTPGPAARQASNLPVYKRRSR